MNINYKESQFEFFPEASEAAEDSRRPRFLAARLTLSVENLVIFMILSIMLVLFSFTMGVERGKRLAVAGPDVGAVSASEATVSVRDTRSSGSVRSEAAKPPAAPAAAEEKRVPEQSSVPAVAAAPSGAYTIQVASYNTEEPARKEASHLKQNGFNEVYVLTKGSYVILCVGNFEKMEEASLLGKKLKSRYRDNYVRRL